MKKEKVLVHSCCGVCASFVVETLKNENKEVVLFFYNPNIYPQKEYQKRLGVIKKVSKIFGVKLIVGRYEPEKWLSFVKGFEDEPEGGKRCRRCYLFRLKETAQKAKELETKTFTTTLTISPYKKAKLINRIGKAVGKEAGIVFLERDFKKKDGFKKTMAFAKKHNFYRQKYCGCIFSLFENGKIRTKPEKNHGNNR